MSYGSEGAYELAPKSPREEAAFTGGFFMFVGKFM